jgi:hypothetical protein
MQRHGNYRKRIVLGCSLLLSGFVVGCLASRWIIVSPKPSTQRAYVREQGDAPGPVRTEVLESLREFQAGYSPRDPNQLDDFMKRLFPEDQDIRIIGTDVTEWKNGYQSIARLIETDWLDWGDLHLDVDDSIINSLGDVAWLATTGTVVSARSSRSIRYTAVLTRRNGRWIFRQIQFQWDERLLTVSDVVKSNGLSHIHLR